MATPDFRAAPVPAGLMQEDIRARSVDRGTENIKSAMGGIEQGLALTQKIDAVRQKRKMAREISNVVASPEFQEFDQETKGLAGLSVKNDPLGTLNIFRQMKEQKAAGPNLKPIQDELEAIQKAAKDYGWNDELRGRFEELGTMLKTGTAYGWAKGLKETQAVKMKKTQIEQARKQDPEYDALFKQVNVAKEAYAKSKKEVDEKAYTGAKETFVGYHNAKYPNNPIPTFEEADQYFYGIPIGKKVVPTNLSPEDKAAYDWAEKNPKDPRAKDIKQRLGA